MAGDIGKHLVAVARYMDRTEDTNNNPDDNNESADPPFIRFNNMATSAVTAPRD